MRFILNLLFIALFTINAFAQAPATEFTPAELSAKELKLSLKVTDIWTRFAITHPDETFLKQSDETIKAEMKKFLKDILREEAATEALKESAPVIEKAAEEAMSRIKWNQLIAKVRTARASARTFVRIKGVGLASAILASYIADLFVTPSLYSTDYYFVLIPVWFALSNSGTVYLGYSAAQKLMHRNRMIKLFGSKEAYLEFINGNEEMMKAMNIRNTTDLLVTLPAVEGGFETAVVTNGSMKDLIYTKMGIREERLTYKKLSEFCKSNGILTDVVEALEARTDLPKAYKAGALLNAMRQAELKGELSTEQVLAIRKTYNRYFTKLENFGEYAALKNWALEFINANTVEDLEKIFLKVPKDASPEIVSQIWQEIGLPCFTENNRTLALPDFIKLRKNYTHLKVACYRNASEKWSEAWSARFGIYIENATSDAKNCGLFMKTTRDVLKFIGGT